MSPASSRCRNGSASRRISRPRGSILPEDHAQHASLVDQSEPARPQTVRAKHAASLIVLRIEPGVSRPHGGTFPPKGAATGPGEGEPHMLMGMRGARHRFMPNRLVFPGGAVDRADLSAPCLTGLSARTEAALHRNANAKLARGLGVAAARELHEETGLSLGLPPALDGLEYLARAVTPAD